MTPIRETVGSQSLKARSDSTKYDSLEVGHALCEDVLEQIWKCIDSHKSVINEPEFCVVMVLADDPLIKGVMRRKFYAWPYLPSPRPRQSCFHYEKSSETVSRLWVLPDAMTMASLSETPMVSPAYQTMKFWCDAFFSKSFWHKIRQQHGIKMLSEHEYLNAHRDELIHAGCKLVDSLPPEPFDFSKISVEKIVDTKTAVGEQPFLDRFGKA